MTERWLAAKAGLARCTWVPLRAWFAVLLLALLAPAAWGQAAAPRFNHDTTGFALTGKHEDVRCETCHQRGIFKGTPRDCATCHAQNNSRGATAMPVRHVQTAQACDACHGTSSFAGVIFSHVAVAPSSCNSCHDGLRAIGKPAGHPATTASCDLCHVTASFAGQARKPTNHIPYAASATCVSCHVGGFTVSPTLTAIHANAPSTTNNCAQCHGAAAASFAIPAKGFSVVGLPADHLPTTASCETCHVGPGSSVAATPVTDGARFSGSLMNHAGISSNCVACHAPIGSGLNFAGVARIVGMPATSPPGPLAHIPSSTRCESCHLGSLPSGLIPASATKTAPGTGFATPAPTAAMIHSGVTSGCNACHDTAMVWLGVGAYPINPATMVTGASYTGFQTRPRAAAGAFNVVDPAHPVGGDCSECHAGTTAFTGTAKPDNHIPYNPAASCNACHRSPNFSITPTLADIHANAPSTSGNCAQCHGAAAPSFAIPANGFVVVGLPANHIPTNASCETCHVGPGSSIAAVPVVDGAKFSGSTMNHAGIASNCAACHQPAGAATAFAGITRIVGMPPTSPAGPGAHIPSSTTCESCHLASVPAGPVPASATATAPGTGFATPAPSGAMIHAGITSGCAGCHEAGLTWMGVSAYPISPATLVPGASYTGFHTRPRAAGSATSIADPAHPPTGDCERCHASTTVFTGIDKPANHIPYSPAAACSSCHRGTDYAVMPSLTDIHANAPSTTTNCAQCHGAAAPSFAIPANGFAIVGLPSNHIPTNASCEACHVGTGSSIATLPVVDGARFANSRMNHAGIAGNCVTCHQASGGGGSFAGITRIVGMPPTSPPGPGSHIPSSTACESCHLASMPSGLIPASATATAPGTGFATPAPSGPMIHSGITSGCSACHETGMVWMGVSNYPISPTTLVPGASYRGFQTRPGAAASTYSVANPAHPAGGDCSQCHASTSAFTGVDKPANHIPTNPAAQCANCHVGNDYATIPSLTSIHTWAPSTTGNCAQCHGAAAPSFAIPAVGFSIVGMPNNHIPSTAPCEQCHVGAGSSITVLPVADGARFANSAMNHAGITGNCVACHQAAGSSTTFAGITRIVGMPPTSPAGPNAHIPSSTRCESCHLASLPSGLIPSSATATAPGTGFATPAPTGPMIHSGVTGGCNACHEAGLVWMGMGAYPISPSILSQGALYTGFQTRPRAAAGTFNIANAAHPATGDCSQCHGSTTAFSGIDKPANHIPYNPQATCDNCHTSPDYAVLPSLTNIHAWAPSTTSNCSQCHGAAAPSFAIPTAGFAIVGLPSNHIPTSASCETCHVGTGSSIAALPVVDGARFTNSRMNHAGITKDCVNCHQTAGSSTAFAGITRIVGMPPTNPPGASSHIPSTTACETCHLGSMPTGLIPASATRTAPGTAFATPAPTGPMIHNGVTSGCAACHDSGYVWMGVSAYPITPTTLTPGAQYKGFQTRPRAAAGTYNVADPAHPLNGDCSQCHASTTAFTAVDMPGNHIPFAPTAQCNSCHTGTDYAVMPSIANIHLHAPSTTSNCSQCHGAAAPSFAIPAANFSIVGLPSNHVPTTASCEVCHVGAGSSIAALPVPNGAKFSGSKMSHNGITSNCVACHVPAGTAVNFIGITRISTMPPTAPMGAGSHIPSSTTCETCHLGAKPAGLVNASASANPPGTAWATPAPTGAMIHTGITSGCSGCHDTGYVWMGMSAYPIAPSTLTPGAQYKGFQTRPRAAAGTFNVADAAHPASGDCSLCHTNTVAFVGVDKPGNHIPTNPAATCANCHTSTDYAVLPTLTNIHAWAPSTTSNCSQCHGAAAPTFAIPSANFSIVGLPSNHIPTTASCEVCHVGAGSSITALPVVNGAKFANSKMSHDGITSNCVACHVTNATVVNFAGITRISKMPSTSPVGTSSHIPSSTSCETCHLGSKPAGLVNASATVNPPGTAWATPAPTGAMIHTGITANCNACHDTGYAWMGMGAYPISPTQLTSGAQYKGFHTRPRAAAGTFNVADAAHPTSGDCSTCHTGTTYFDGAVKPSGHIPTNSACSLCHVVAGDFSVAGLTNNTAMHANTDLKSQTCRSCHAAGPFAGCTTQAACTTPVPLTYQPKLMPLAAGGSPTAPSAQTHIPVGSVACEACHSATNYTTFSGMKMKPTTNAINPSHTAVAAFSCMSCHEYPYVWFGTPNIQTRKPGEHTSAGRRPPHDCDECHRVGTKFDGLARVRPVMRAAVGGALPRLLPREAILPGGSTKQAFDHRGVAAGQCQTCHNGQIARGRPAKHYGPRLSCDSCHRSTAWAPASFTHPSNAAGTCAACHNGVDASGRPGSHFISVRSCDACHTALAWQPVRYQHLSPAYAPSPERPTCVSCHITNGEVIPRQLHGNPRNRPVPVPPKTGP